MACETHPSLSSFVNVAGNLRTYENIIHMALTKVDNDSMGLNSCIDYGRGVACG